MANVNSSGKKVLSVLETVDAWGHFTIKIWQEKLAKYKIGRSGRLNTSFSKSIAGTAKGENIVIRFQFLYYGKFIDMGVGKGTPLGGVKENKTSRALSGKMTGNRRFPKKWYSKTLFAETATLKEILARDFAHKGALTIIENIGDNSKRI